ncbi:hypothetical protein DEU56DRAFT_902807 [Suillus clintonianus]|uniref:uncharacterized protein n=1 Tax=Suillus clintonianus TaxID=1904413 RepID=UPI001B863057|nr:uncharacterized protein DEU56DRAFT_902807 [Suillus clintonianus]KAG2129740.1 hypothetical protein DEU56DRAFT_902807 [Suillus clintonianus]
MSSKESFTTSSLSLSLNEDWDRSESDIIVPQTQAPRHSVPFPAEDVQADCSAPGENKSRKARSLSELMRLHVEKGTGVTFNVEEASRVADVLKQWINSGTSPYEGEDDFFSRANDDLSLGAKRSLQLGGRTRGQTTCTCSVESPQPCTLNSHDGKLLKAISNSAHQQGQTCITFSRDGNAVTQHIRARAGM